ncbi:MAG: DUF4382 domain-containing protein [Acidobacteriales bacterium]|nr:DUF4382 domain-containing protein [Terriglobales bacterium]
MRIKLFSIVATALAVAITSLLIACGEGAQGPNGSAGMGFINTRISDPATCAAPSGPFSHVIVTVTRVRAHRSATAPDNDGGWIDLTLANMTPVQVDLLGTHSAQCFLAQLGTNVQIPAGTYQQIRVILLDNNQAQALGANNQCGTGNGANCVVLTSDGSTRRLNLSSEAQTGIKLVTGQISGGSFTVEAGQTANINLNFNACASIVSTGNNQFRLKPVVHADSISQVLNISGRVVDSVTQATVSGGKVVVALEQRDSSGVDRVIMETTPDGGGNFVFCPVAPSTYEVVVTAVNGSNVAYAATVTTGVQPGASLGNIPIIPQPGSGSVTSPASITGSITTTGSAGATPADVVLSALQSVTIGSSNVPVTIPLAAQGASTLTSTTQAGGCSPATNACANYTLQVPAANPNVGAFAAAGTTYTQNTASPVNYTVDGRAFGLNSSSTPTCTPPVVQVSTLSGGGPLVVTGGASASAATLAFSSCQ